MSDDFRTLLPVDHREPVAGPTTHQTPRRDGVDAPSCITSRYHPKEKLKLLVRSSRRRKALLQLFLALGERCTDGATARSRNGYRDRDRGRPVLLVRPVRVVAVTSSILAILIFFVAASATVYVLGNCCAEPRGSCM